MFDAKDPAMQNAFQAAQASFRYFWRELSWEMRRIVPGLDMAMVKFPFSDGPRTDGNPEFEHMWIGDVGFDGDSVSGTLLNSPRWLNSVREGDDVSLPFDHVTDWMMTVDGRAYGGFTVNLMRSRMSDNERDQHDQAWGLEFGDPSNVQVEISRTVGPEAAGMKSSDVSPEGVSETYVEHPMSVNMLPEIKVQLEADQSIATFTGDDGWTLLQQEAMAGNFGIVKLLVTHGADVSARTPSGYTAAELAKKIGWSEIAEFIRSAS